MVETKLFDLTGKVALMTGASKGMGKAMAHALAAHGATVVISARSGDLSIDDACYQLRTLLMLIVGPRAAEGRKALKEQMRKAREEGDLAGREDGA